MKKNRIFLGLAICSVLAGGDAVAAECRPGFSPIAPSSEAYDEMSGSLDAQCAEKKPFHLPPAVPLILSAIAGLGVVAYRGRPR